MLKFENVKIFLDNKELKEVESYDIHFHENQMLPKITIRQRIEGDESWISFNAYWLTDMNKKGNSLELEVAPIDSNII